MGSFVKAFLLTLTAACLGQDNNLGRSIRVPQGHIMYSDPNGLKVNWKLYAPYSQWKSHLENPQRSQKTETTIQSSESIVQSQQQAAKLQPKVLSQKVQYKPYTAVPEHVKQLIHRTYGSQAPYVDPEYFAYQNQGQDTRVTHDQSSVRSKSGQKLVEQRMTNYGLKYQPNARYEGKISTSGQREYQRLDQLSVAQTNPRFQDRKHTPLEIQQLLQFQAQLPYNVIANRIAYRPKSLFIPKPLPESDLEPYRYRSKVYFVKNGQPNAEDQPVKPYTGKRKRQQ